MENKKGKGLVVCFIISILVILGLVAYIYYDKEIIVEKTESNKQEVNNQVKIKAKDISESDIADILKRIEVMNQNIYDQYPLTNVNNIPSQELLSIGLMNSFGAYSVPIDAVEGRIKYIIGDNVVIKHENFLCTLDNIPFYTLGKGYYSFNQEHPGHGGGDGYIVKAFFKSAKLEGDTLTVNMNLLYEKAGDTLGAVAAYFDSATNDANMVIKDVDREQENFDAAVKTEYEKIKDNLPTTTYTFKRSEFAGFNLESVAIK